MDGEETGRGEEGKREEKGEEEATQKVFSMQISEIWAFKSRQKPVKTKGNVLASAKIPSGGACGGLTLTFQ